MRKATATFLPSLKPPSYISLFSIKPFSSSSSPSSPSPSPPPFIVDYLIRSLGCSQESALKASKRLHHVKSPTKPDSVISFLRALGLSQSQLAHAVLRRPLILISDVQSNLLPKVHLYKSLNLSDNELADLIAASTACFGNSTKNRLTPSLNFLKSILQNNSDKVRRALKRCPMILAYDPTKIPLRNVEFLRSKGLDSDSITEIVHKYPSVLLWKVDQLVSAWEFAEEMGLNQKHKGFGDAFHIMKTTSKDIASSKLNILKSFGCEGPVVAELFRFSAAVFRSSDEILRKRCDFFFNKVGYSPAKLLRNPFQWGIRLEERLMPRYTFIKNLQSKGLLPDEVNYGRIFLMPKESFVDEFVNKFKDQVGLDAVKAYKECGRHSKRLSIKDSKLKEAALF